MEFRVSGLETEAALGHRFAKAEYFRTGELSLPRLALQLSQLPVAFSVFYEPLSCQSPINYKSSAFSQACSITLSSVCSCFS